MKKGILILLIALFTQSMYAQKQTWNWTFGSYAGLTWQPDKLRSLAAVGMNGTANATLDNLPGAFTSSINNMEGVFSISDVDGNLLFYSDGIKIWRADGTQIFTGLGGHMSSAQSGIVLPYPGSDNQYICIGISETSNNKMNYVTVQANSPSDVTVIGTAVAFSGHKGVLGESMTAVKHSNGVDWWILAPGRSNTSSSVTTGKTYFNAWLATATGVQPVPVISECNILVKAVSNGYLKITPDSKHFAYGTWADQKLLYGDFDISNGLFTNVRSFAYGVYGIEFSPNQKYLYTTVPQNGGSTIGWYIWDFEALLANTTSAPMKYLSISGLTSPGAFQIDPTGRIWNTGYGIPAGSLLTIDNPDEPNNLKIYRVDNVLNSGSSGTLSLPSFSSTFFKLAEVEDICINTEKEFSIYISATIGGSTVSYTLWSFGDGSTSGKVDGSGTLTQSHAYKNPGKYTVTVSAYDANDNKLGSSQTVNVNILPCSMPVNPNIHLYK